MKPLYQIDQKTQQEFADRMLIQRAYEVYIANEGWDGEVQAPTTVAQARYILKMMGELD
jgi:hypothetical protein